MDNSIFTILSTVAVVLLLLVTLGIGYITVSGWRDRRRQEADRRASR